jgi:type I restriction enzyme S subunit
MELRPGFKQTEVGIPEDWETRRCFEISERITVGVVIRPTQYYVPYGIPALRSANIRENGISDSDLVFISEKANAMLAKSQTRTGDVLTVRTGYPGTSAVVRPVHAGWNCIDILITSPSASVDSDFLARWINSAGSDGRRNTCLQSTCRSLEAQGLSGTSIQAQCDLVELRL